VLAALQSVDLVTLFDESTPLELLKIVRPELYVKGGDYDVEALAETALVRSWGGNARALAFVDGYSTSALVARIRG
jgi:bifunctional ADP-heptose synthase (sugar kinase/adenylyltransferase)